jgi:hypothetical protein
MAAKRGRPPGFKMPDEHKAKLAHSHFHRGPYYVYRLIGEQGETMYIGKGQNGRLRDQMRRHKLAGEIMEEFGKGQGLEAYKREAELIREHCPPLNIVGKEDGKTQGRQDRQASNQAP